MSNKLYVRFILRNDVIKVFRFNIVYKWFDALISKVHQIAGYVLLTNYLLAIISFTYFLRIELFYPEKPSWAW